MSSKKTSPDRPIFNEETLKAEIEKTWGAHGAHAEVYGMLLCELEKLKAENKKSIELTALQKRFIKCAIDVRVAVLPFDSLDDRTFKQDYGFTKKEMQQEIQILRGKLSK